MERRKIFFGSLMLITVLASGCEDNAPDLAGNLKAKCKTDPAASVSESIYLNEGI